MHQLKEVDMLYAKMDLLMKRLEDEALRRRKSCNSHMTCEECGNTRQSGSQCP
jgi:hypothetical protein